MSPKNGTKRKSVAEEGAAMLIVMLVLLMTTATAIFAVHATQYEIRGAGAGRQGLQTQYVGETGAMSAVQRIDTLYGGRSGLDWALTNSVTGRPPTNYMAPLFEPELIPTKENVRFYLSDITAGTPSNWPIETDPTRGPSLGRTYISPNFIVDINDNIACNMPIAGANMTGGANIGYTCVTVSSHGRTDVTADYRNVTYDTRLYHEGASDARAYLSVGPGAP